jgi:drug/metabolite transporter (DMT)-like permease
MFIVSSFLFAVMGVFIKLASAHAPASEIAFVRFMVGIIFTLLLACTGKISLASENKLLLIGRGFFGGLATLLFFMAIKAGTLTNATVLNNCYPIFATVIAAIYIKEKLDYRIALSFIASISGIIMLTQPNLTHIKAGDVYALVSALLAGISIVMIRQLRHTSVWTVFFYLNIFGAVFSGFVAYPQMVMPTMTGIVYMLLGALFATAGQIIMTEGYKYCTASKGSVLSMATAVFASLFGFLFLGDRLTAFEGLGALIIIASSAYIAYHGSGKGSDNKEHLHSC